jgi:glycosyltransferase involved in cell wall biosynthesis
VIRVLHLITRLDVGGSAENTLLSATRLSGGDFQISLAYGPTNGPPAALVEILSRSEVAALEIPHLIRAIRPLRDLRALHEIRAIIHTLRPHILHTHTSKAGFLGRLAARQEHVPHIVHTPHGHVFHGYFPPTITRAIIQLERLAARWTDRILTLTDAEAEQHLALGVGRREQFVTIPSGVDLESVLAAVPRRVVPQGRIIGTVGRLTAIKGQEHLIRATPILLKRHPDVTVLLVGEGEQRESLQRLSDALGVSRAVHFTGHREDVASLIAGMDVFVLPSLNEGMGRVLVMAMALGKPIVASRTGGVPELLENGRAGVLVPPANPEAIAEAVGDLLDNPQKAKALIEAGSRRAPRYSTRVMLDSLEKLYRELTVEGPRTTSHGH